MTIHTALYYDCSYLHHKQLDSFAGGQFAVEPPHMTARCERALSPYSRSSWGARIVGNSKRGPSGGGTIRNHFDAVDKSKLDAANGARRVAFREGPIIHRGDRLKGNRF